MRVTTQGEYGIRCLLLLAREPDGRFVPISEMAEREDLSKEYVEQLMLRLRRARIVNSTRGIRGGYQLALKPEDISLRQILTVLEGDTFEVMCDRLNTGHKSCVNFGRCSVRPVWMHIKKVLDRVMDDITLDIMLLDEAGVVRRLRALEAPWLVEHAASR